MPGRPKTIGWRPKDERNIAAGLAGGAGKKSIRGGWHKALVVRGGGGVMYT